MSCIISPGRLGDGAGVPRMQMSVLAMDGNEITEPRVARIKRIEINKVYAK